MSETTRTRLSIALIVAPMLIQLLFVSRLGVNSLYWDEYHYGDFVRQVRDGGDVLPYLWYQHNEHRVVPTKLVMIPNALYGNWNRLNEMYVSVLLGALVVPGLWCLARRSAVDLLLFAPVSWIVLSLAQHENLTYGLMTCHYFTTLGVVWALACLEIGGAGRLAAAVAFGCLASFSTVSGFLVWPVGFFLLAARVERTRAALAWIACGGAATCAYLYRFVMPGNTPHPDLSIGGIVRSARFFVTALGAPLSGSSPWWAVVLGLMTVAFAAVTVARWRAEGRAGFRDEAVPASLLLFGMLSSAMVALGRAGMAVPAVESRYITYSSFAVAGIYLLVCSRLRRSGESARTSRTFAVTATLLAAGLAAANLSGISEARASKVDREVRKFLLQTFDRQSDAVLGTLNLATVVRANAPYLRDRKLGPFADPQELLIPAPGGDAPEAIALMSGRTIAQSFVSPLDVVHDVAIELGAATPDERTRITMTLAASGATIARKTFGAEELSPHGWLRLPLGEPLIDARGRTFTVTLTTEPGAGPASTVAVATRVPYYDGALRVADSPLPGRALGVSLDAIRLRVIR